MAIDKHWENQEMKHKHNANVKLKTERREVIQLYKEMTIK